MIWLAGDVMTGRGVDQAMPAHCDPRPIEGTARPRGQIVDQADGSGRLTRAQSLTGTDQDRGCEGGDPLTREHRCVENWTRTRRAALLGAAAASGWLAACHLTGENLAAAALDEWRLTRASLNDLDTHCARNPCDSGLVVTLTSIPSRIGLLDLTLKSLMRQTARPREIRLCLPSWSVREQRRYALPRWLSRLESVTVMRVDDQGPATKLLSTLDDVDADQAVVVVDDDRVYHPRLLETYAHLAARHPHHAVTAAGWRIPPDRIDRPTTLWRRLTGAPTVPRRAHQLRRAERTDIMQGLHSYMVRPRFFDLEALHDLAAAPPAVRWVDDVWISLHCRAEKWIVPMALDYTDYLPWSRAKRIHASSLGRNVNHARDDAARGNSVALQWFAERATSIAAESAARTL